MKLPQAIKKALCQGALYYTAITVTLALICIFMNDAGNVLLKPERFLEIFLFSLIASCASVIYYENLLPSALGFLVHFFGYVGGFFFCLVLPLKSGFTSSVVITLLYIIIYTILSVIFITSNKKKKKLNQAPKIKQQKDTMKIKEKNKKSEYVSQFQSSNRDDKS